MVSRFFWVVVFSFAKSIKRLFTHFEDKDNAVCRVSPTFYWRDNFHNLKELHKQDYDIGPECMYRLETRIRDAKVYDWLCSIIEDFPLRFLKKLYKQDYKYMYKESQLIKIEEWFRTKIDNFDEAYEQVKKEVLGL